MYDLSRGSLKVLSFCPKRTGEWEWDGGNTLEDHGRGNSYPSITSCPRALEGTEMYYIHVRLRSDGCF